ncbi:MAG TPA: hypothetical protein PK417_02760 [Hyphomonas sp.]|nr:hypothetical protein [Hyphomonas sp.]HRX72702.1 hypothetical protein [Hyphomonas sp.]
MMRRGRFAWSALVLLLAACGGGPRDPAGLAKEINAFSGESVTVRKTPAFFFDDIEVARTEALTARRVAGMFEETWLVELRQWDCAPTIEKPEACGRKEGVAIDYFIKKEYIDPASITVTQPDIERGESGLAVEFGCSPNYDKSCFSAYVGKFGFYAPCGERDCDAAAREAEDAAVKTANDVTAASNRLRIACANPKSCDRLAAKLRQFLDAVSGRAYIDNGKAMEEAVARLDAASRGAEHVVDPVNWFDSYVAGNTLSSAERVAYRGRSIELDPDGDLRIALDVCGADDAAGCVEEEWERKVSRVSLADLDATQMALFDFENINDGKYETEYQGASVYGGCRVKDGCIENVGADASGLDVFFPCRDKEACGQATADFGGIASFAATPAFAEWLRAHREAMKPATAIGDARQAERAARRISGHVKGATLDDRHGVFLAEGAELYEDRFLIVSGKACDDGDDCAAAATRYGYSFDLAGLDPAALYVDPLAPDDQDPRLRVECGAIDKCIRFAEDGAEVGNWTTAYYLPCNDADACGAILKDLRGLIRFVSDASRSEKPRKGAMGRLAGRIADLATGGGRIYATENSVRYLELFKDAWARDGALLVSLETCRLGDGKDCAEDALPEQVYQEISLADAKPDAISTRLFDRDGGEIGFLDDFFAQKDDPGADNYAVVVFCRDGGACVSNNGIRAHNVLTVPCPGEEACDEIVALLKEQASAGAPPPRKPASAGTDARRNESSLTALRDAVAGAEISLPVTGAEVTRLMRGLDVAFDEAGALLVRREVCLAILRAGHSRGNECSVDTLFRDYDLAIDLAGLDAGSVEAMSGRGGGERDDWVTAACKGGVACAALDPPEMPLHSVFEFSTLMTGFGESANAPIIRIPCTDAAACRKAADALKRLARSSKPKQASDNKSAPSSRVDPRIVGAWTLAIPQQTNWTWEFRADATYAFAMDQTRFQGEYTAKDGVWSQKAVNFASEDSGTYRFHDNDTLELTGRLGTSIWKRRK